MRLKVKGINDGLLMTLPDASWDECCEAVRETIGENLGFFTGANLFLDAGTLDIRVIEITSFRSELEKNGILLKGIFGKSEKTMQNCRSLGMMTEPEVRRSSLRKEQIEAAQPSKEIGENAYLINRTIRSGTRIERKESIIVLGDVNPGAELISEKNVIVMGIVRGRISAGNMYGNDSYISAFGFDNAQVMINGAMKLLKMSGGDREHTGLILVRNKFGEIEIEKK